MTRDLTRAEVATLRDLFDRTEPDQGRDIAIEAVATAALELPDPAVAGTTPLSPAARLIAQNLIEWTARQWMIPLQTLLSPSKPTNVVRCRFECMGRLRALRFSTLAIGELLNRDHSTVVAGLRRFDEEQPALSAQLFGVAVGRAEARAV